MSLLLVRFLPTLLALHVAHSQLSICGPSGFSIAGSASVLPIAEAWRDAYLEECPGLEIKVDGGGSSDGAARLCGNVDDPSEMVQIGDMSREWEVTEAVPKGTTGNDQHVYECVAGNTSLSAIQIDVAVDGISIVSTGGGTAASCIERLGGLTIHQLRWIYSSYSETQLEESGWDPNSVPNRDGDDTTRLWSELDEFCESVPIMIVGPDDSSGTYLYFAEVVLTDFANGETFATSRNYTGRDDPAFNVGLIEANPQAIAYVGYAYYYINGIDLYAAAIMNENGDYVVPGADSVADGTYNPLSRRIYMNLLNDPVSLANTAPFVYLGFSPDGSDVVARTGYVPIPNPSEMLARLAEYASVDTTVLVAGEDDSAATPRTSTLVAAATSTIVMGALWIWAY